MDFQEICKLILNSLASGYFLSYLKYQIGLYIPRIAPLKSPKR